MSILNIRYSPGRQYPRIIALVVSFTLLTLASVTSSEALCVSSKRANLRQGPGKHYKQIWEVFQYMPFKELGRQGNWYRVQDVDGDIYWIFSKLVTRDYNCAVIKNNKTNMRKGPGTQYPMVKWSPVDKFFSMKVLEIKNGWVHTEDSVGDRAWIYRPLVWIH